MMDFNINELCVYTSYLNFISNHRITTYEFVYLNSCFINTYVNYISVYNVC